MHRNSTAQALVQVRGPNVTYGNLRFTPVVDSRAHSLEVAGFKIRKDGDEFTLEDLPVAKTITERAKDDIILNTFEMDDDERSEYFEIDFEIPEYDEIARIHFRAVETPAWPDHLIFEVEDGCGDWLPIEDVFLSELLPDSFVRVMESSIMSQIDDHSLDMLPIAAE